MAVMYIQNRADLNEKGEVKAELNGLNVSYKSEYPDADRWAKNGYRKVYPASKVPADQRVDNELWYYWDNDEQKFEKVDPREVARLRLEYVGLAAKDQNPYDTTVYPNKDDSLTLPKLQLYGINRWQDIRKNYAVKIGRASCRERV